MTDKVPPIAIDAYPNHGSHAQPKVWSKPEYEAADNAYNKAITEDCNDRMSALADAVNAAADIIRLDEREKIIKSIRAMADEDERSGRKEHAEAIRWVALNLALDGSKHAKK